MKRILLILVGVAFAALLLSTFWFLWKKTRPVKTVYAIEQPKLTRCGSSSSPQARYSRATKWKSSRKSRVSSLSCTRKPVRPSAKVKSSPR